MLLRTLVYYIHEVFYTQTTPLLTMTMQKLQWSQNLNLFSLKNRRAKKKHSIEYEKAVTIVDFYTFFLDDKLL